MDEQELLRKRLVDLSRQADSKNIVTFSNFLNLNEQNILHSTKSNLYTRAELFGGYEQAERQMAAFIPDALCYEFVYPMVCIKAEPLYPKFAEDLTHRDFLGALMHLGIDRGKIGDIVCSDSSYVFCEENIHKYIMEQLTQVKHTMMKLTLFENMQSVRVSLQFKEQSEIIASNRIDAIIAKAYHLSRAEAAGYLRAEKVFINGKCITNCNQYCENHAVVSVRGMGRFLFETDNSLSKKGKLRVRFMKFL